MKIFLDYNTNFYSEKNRVLGNCITVIDNNKYFYYEFIPKNNEALIKCNSLEYIIEAVNEYRKYKKYINTFYTEDKSYYEEFEYIHSFKLPISCIQPSKFFIDRKYLDIYEKYKEYDDIHVKVAIINDEYVCLDGHTKLYAMLNDYEKLVNVFIDEYEDKINDFVYIAKEQNIRSIKSIEIISHEEYLQFIDEFEKQF